MASSPFLITANLWRDVRAVAIGDDLVFLKIENDSYFCLPGAAAEASLAPDGRTLHVRDEQLAAELSAAGLVGLDASLADVPDRAAPSATRTAVPSRMEPPRPADVLEAARGLIDLLLHYRGRSFAQILAAGPTQGREPREPLLAVVRRYQRWIPYAPVSGKCLLRSFMLLRLLRRRGHDALWVFGVTTWPFGAHCWLQSGDLVLDDLCDRVALYSPILVV